VRVVVRKNETERKTNSLFDRSIDRDFQLSSSTFNSADVVERLEQVSRRVAQYPPPKNPAAFLANGRDSSRVV
jgi:hypothetical protein